VHIASCVNLTQVLPRPRAEERDSGHNGDGQEWEVGVQPRHAASHALIAVRQHHSAQVLRVPVTQGPGRCCGMLCSEKRVRLTLVAKREHE
jgi:hypothetical protein